MNIKGSGSKALQELEQGCMIALVMRHQRVNLAQVRMDICWVNYINHDMILSFLSMSVESNTQL